MLIIHHIITLIIYLVIILLAFLFIYLARCQHPEERLSQFKQTSLNKLHLKKLPLKHYKYSILNQCSYRYQKFLNHLQRAKSLMTNDWLKKIRHGQSIGVKYHKWCPTLTTIEVICKAWWKTLD